MAYADVENGRAVLVERANRRFDVGATAEDAYLAVPDQTPLTGGGSWLARASAARAGVRLRMRFLSFG
jgi:hypothetical protein